MEFTFEYDNGRKKLYHGSGDQKKEVSIEKLGWNTSPAFEIAARMIYQTFDEYMRRISKEPIDKNYKIVGKLSLEIKILPKKNLKRN